MGGTNYIRNKNGVLFTSPIQTTVNSLYGGSEVSDIAGIETTLSSVLIPANAFQTSDLIEIESRLRKSSVVPFGSCIMKVRIGTAQTTSDVLIATFSSSTTTNNFYQIKRTLKITSATTTSEILDPTANLSIDNNFSGYTLSNVSINWGINNYISVTATLSSATDGINCMHIRTKRFPST